MASKSEIVFSSVQTCSCGWESGHMTERRIVGYQRGRDLRYQCMWTVHLRPGIEADFIEILWEILRDILGEILMEIFDDSLEDI